MHAHEESFLRRLQKMYNALAVLVESRLKSFRNAHHSNPQTSIKPTMLKQVRSISKQARKQKQNLNATPISHPDVYRRNEIDANNSSYEPKHINDSELSKHLKKSERMTAHLHLVDDLKKRTWEHVHSALRFARLGDEFNAVLHTKIAADSLDEIRHYINETEYLSLTDKIEQYLNS